MVGASCCAVLTLLACPKVPQDDTAAATCQSDGDRQCDDGDDDDGPGGGVLSGGGSGGTSGITQNGGSAGDDGFGGYGSDGPGPVIGGGASGSAGSSGMPTQGELVVVAFDSGTRMEGHQQIVFNGGRVFWTRDQNNRLAIFSASLSGPLPAAPETLLDSEWFPSSGWSNPPLLVTSTHIMLPIIGTIDAGNGFVDTDGWATLRRDGSELQLARFHRWWLAAHGANVVMPDPDVYAQDPVSREINLTTGEETPRPNFASGDGCAYDAAQDEAGCAGYGVRSYSFATDSSKTIVESPSIPGQVFGTPRIGFNSSHWFVGHALGLAAYPREGGGNPTYYRSIDPSVEAFAVDDTAVFVCIENDIVRVSLADETHEALTHGDCESNNGLGSVLGIDGAYVYYTGVREISYGARPVEIRRISRTAPGTPLPAPAD